MPAKQHIDTRSWGERVKARMERDARPPEPKRRPAMPARFQDQRPTYGDHRAYDAALARPCAKHQAPQGVPCFDGGGVVGLCSARTQTPAAALPPDPARARQRGTTTTTKGQR